MGLNFKKELVVDEVVVFPAGVRDAPPPTRLQERLLNKLGKAGRYQVKPMMKFLSSIIVRYF